MIKTLADQINKWLKNFTKENEIPNFFVLEWANWYQPGQYPELVNKTLEIHYVMITPVTELYYMDLTIGSPFIRDVKIRDLDNDSLVDYDNLSRYIQETIVNEIWKDYQKKKAS
jgi:hypothetical protein